MKPTKSSTIKSSDPLQNSQSMWSLSSASDISFKTAKSNFSSSNYNISQTETCPETSASVQKKKKSHAGHPTSPGYLKPTRSSTYKSFESDSLQSSKSMLSLSPSKTNKTNNKFASNYNLSQRQLSNAGKTKCYYLSLE